MYNKNENNRVESNAGEHTGVFRKLKCALDKNRLGDLLILKGYISSGDLASALMVQRETNRPLGQIFLEQSRISKIQLARLLMSQRALRFTAGFVLVCSSLGIVSKKTHAASIKDVPARISLVSAGGNGIQNMKSYPDLFGAGEKKSTNLKAFTKWTSMFERFDKEINDAASEKILKSLQLELSDYKSSSILEMATKVNDLMNEQKYIVDNKNWGKSDYWATPVEFLSRGGDCEDFAIAKYTALRALGVPENRLRIAIVQDQRKNVPHAILVVYAEKGAVILDNQIKSVRAASRISHYKPIFSINREAWWLHTTPAGNKNTIVAAAK